MNFKSYMNSDSPFMNGIYKFNLLVGVNMLVLLCCIPVVTAGAALTAMHDYVFNLHENTEGAVLRSFTASFRRNFKQATAAWLLFLGVFAVIAADVLIFVYTEFECPLIIKIIFIEAAVILFGMLCYCFPLLANFKGSLRVILKDSFLMGAGMIKKTIIVMVVYLLPWVFLIFFPIFGWITLLIGVSGPAYIAVCLYHREFKEIKEKIRVERDEK